jgi:hypothetical protein
MNRKSWSRSLAILPHLCVPLLGPSASLITAPRPKAVAHQDASCCQFPSFLILGADARCDILKSPWSPQGVPLLACLCDLHCGLWSSALPGSAFVPGVSWLLSHHSSQTGSRDPQTCLVHSRPFSWHCPACTQSVYSDSINSSSCQLRCLGTSFPAGSHGDCPICSRCGVTFRAFQIQAWQCTHKYHMTGESLITLARWPSLTTIYYLVRLQHTMVILFALDSGGWNFNRMWSLIKCQNSEGLLWLMWLAMGQARNFPSTLKTLEYSLLQ